MESPRPAEGHSPFLKFNPFKRFSSTTKDGIQSRTMSTAESSQINKIESQNMENGHSLAPIRSKAVSEIIYPSLKKAAVIMLGLYLSVFLVALDRSVCHINQFAVDSLTDMYQNNSWNGYTENHR